jgi:hypothetical protein
VQVLVGGWNVPAVELIPPYGTTDVVLTRRES